MRQACHDHNTLNISFAKNENGQAVVEYILMLVVIVSLVIAGGKMFKELNGFMQSYMGDYIECLMAYGELPSLGVEEAELKKHTDKEFKKCDTKFAKFTFTSGRPGSGTSSSGSSSNNGNSTGSKDSKNSSNSADNKGGNNEDKDTDKAGTNNRYQSGRTSPYQSGQISRFNDASTADGALAASRLDKSKTKLIPGDGEANESGENRSGSGGSYSSSSSSRSKYRAITGKLAEELDKKNPDAKKNDPVAKAITTPEEEGYRFQPRRSTVTPPERRDVASTQDKDLSFGFGDFIKWLFVIGIIVGLVAFFGSQLFGISKSKE